MTHSARAIVIAAAVMSLAAFQVPAAGTGQISGVVVRDDATAQPVRRVTVALTGGGGAGVLAVTADDGRFVFRGVPPGGYTLSASKPGYITARYGATKPGRAGTALAVAAGQRIDNVSLRLLRGGVIAGAVTTADSEPAAEVRVSVLQRVGATGSLSMGGLLELAATTDDRGRYRIYGLPPGEYFVIATMFAAATGAEQETSEADYQRALRAVRGNAVPSPSGDRNSATPLIGSAPMLYPGTASVDDAQPIVLGPAEERTGIDFPIRRVPLARVVGSVVGPDGQPAANVQVTVTSTSPLQGPLMRNFRMPVMAGPDGRFTVDDLAPGGYIVAATTASGGGRGVAPRQAALAAATEVVVDGRDMTVELRLSAGVSVSGRVTFEPADGVAPPDLSRLRATLQLPPGSAVASVIAAPAPLDANGAFRFAGVMPGAYRIGLSGPGVAGSGAVWFLESATVAERSVLDSLLEVGGSDISGVQLTMTARPTVLTGLMQDADGAAAPEYFLIAFPQDPALWRPNSARIQQTRPDADGRFRIRGLSAGAYFLAAVTDVLPGELYDPQFLKSLTATAIRVTLTPGASTTQDIRVK